MLLHEREVVPSGYFTFLNFEKKYNLNIIELTDWPCVCVCVETDSYNG